MKNCIFCKIIEGEIPSTKVFENENYLAFNDIYPKAKNHILIIPKKHIEKFDSITDIIEKEIIKGLFDIAWEVILQNGYIGCQLHLNSGKDHGQEVMHIHLHLLNNG